jgi:hypothetical protein
MRPVLLRPAKPAIILANRRRRGTFVLKERDAGDRAVAATTCNVGRYRKRSKADADDPTLIERICSCKDAETSERRSPDTVLRGTASGQDDLA